MQYKANLFFLRSITEKASELTPGLLYSLIFQEHMPCILLPLLFLKYSQSVRIQFLSQINYLVKITNQLV